MNLIRSQALVVVVVVVAAAREHVLEAFLSSNVLATHGVKFVMGW